METLITDYTVPFTSLATYATDLIKTGIPTFRGSDGTFWMHYQANPLTRLPTFSLEAPALSEVRHTLWRSHAAIATYLIEADEHHSANTWLYLCTDQDYHLDTLSSTARRDIRRALRHLRVGPLTYDELLAHGAQAFCDTRRRVGLRDGTREEFYQRFTRRRLPEVTLLGAWKDQELAGFLSITEVDDWAEITGNFTADSLRQYGASDALVYSTLYHYLRERQCRLVSFGFSSIVNDSHAAGLHHYKKKIGCEAKPVHRAFVPHPLLRPLVNPVTSWSINAMQRLRPGDSRILKARGVLESMHSWTRSSQEKNVKS